MKKYFWIAFLVPMAVHAQQKPGFLLTGKCPDLKENTKVFITDANNPTDTLAHTRAKAGTFVLKGQMAEPNMVELHLGETKVPVFMGNDQILVSGTVSKPAELKITGSPTQDDLNRFQNTFVPYFQQLNHLAQLANTPAGLASRDSITRTYESTLSTVQNKLDQYIAEKKNSYVSAFVLVATAQLSEDIFLLERRFNSLAPAVQQGFYGQYLRQLIDNGKIGAVGTPALDFTQNDTLGNPVSLASYRGKYVLVDFWASWCNPCRMENPNVLATFAKFKDKNFTVLGVSLDRSKDPWIKAIHDDRLAWTQVSDLKFWSNEVAVKYKINSIPQNFLIDPKGMIVGRNLRGPELEAKLCQLLGCN